MHDVYIDRICSCMHVYCIIRHAYSPIYLIHVPYGCPTLPVTYPDAGCVTGCPVM